MDRGCGVADDPPLDCVCLVITLCAQLVADFRETNDRECESILRPSKIYIIDAFLCWIAGLLFVERKLKSLMHNCYQLLPFSRGAQFSMLHQ